jgi:hypothetical protein
MSLTYSETVSQAAERLETAKAALPRDLAQAADAAGWGAFLRDKYDVLELVSRIGERLSDNLFLAELHAAADKVRNLQPKVGRPPKVRQAGQKDDEPLA